MAGDLGYLSAFDGLTIANTTTMKAVLGQEPAADTKDAIDRMQKLANGTIVDYDGTATSSFNYGEVTQVVIVTASAVTHFNTAQLKRGVYGTLTKTLFAGGTETCNARCIDISPLSQSLPGKDTLYIQWIFQTVGAWS